MPRAVGGLVLAVLLCAPADAGAEWQIKPFVGVTFGPHTTYRGDLEFAAGLRSEDPDRESGSTNLAYGLAVVLIGELFGIEGDVGQAPGFFQAGDRKLVQRSSARTLTGNLVVALPRRVGEYTLRPYIVAGMGLMNVHSEDALNAFPIDDTLAAVDVGGGATGFLTDRIGVSWDARHFRSVGGKSGDPRLTVDGARAKLSFWRANMSIVVRY